MMTSSTDGGDVYLTRLLALIAVFSFADAQVNNALYVSNGTHILLIDNRDQANGATGRPVYSPTEGNRIVGLAYSGTSGFLFWSDINRWTSEGIYRAEIDRSGNLTNITRIISTDVQEINGLTVDWVSNNIYWADGRKRTIEVADISGTNRRVLLYQNLVEPRGICADPVDGWLYWNDQGTQRIEKSRLDGSERTVYVSNTSLPNQMIVENRVLYWVDSKDKTLRWTRGKQIVRLAPHTNNAHVYGLAINGNTRTAYVTSWSSTAQLLKVNLDLKTVTVTGTRLSEAQMFSAVYVDSRLHDTADHGQPCSSNRCGQLCLPTSKTTHRCSCSSYGGKTLKSDGSCQDPTHVVLFAMAENGFVGYYDPSSISDTGRNEFHLVGHSSRPVAVAYDPIKQVVYWSDVREQIIYSSRLDGTDSKIFLHRGDGVGIVDGMAVDYVGRQLYYSNIGSVTIESKTYSWHKIETVNIDGYEQKIRTVISSIADKPRAIAIDVTNAKLYYTDWGSKASIVKANLDGSNPVVIKTGLYNPNGLVLSGDHLYVADSNYKTRSLKLGTPKNGSIYRMSIDGTGWTDILSERNAVQLQTPFGLAGNGANTMYVSDWDTKNIREINMDNFTTKEIISGESPMGLLHTAVSVTPPRRPANCSSSTCGDICLGQTPTATICTCNSYSGKALTADKRTCGTPAGYLLVSDMDAVKLVSLDSTDDRSTYVIAKGRPFDSNFVALAYHETTNTIFYSDISSTWIYAYYVANETSTEFYQIKNVIDGMTIDSGTLYWTDSEKGQILSLKINSDPSTRRHTPIISDLDRPRAIKVYDSHIYWTEWGSNPRVARMPVDQDEPSNSYSGELKWPNALFPYGGRIYVADGFPTERKLINCSMDLSDCKTVAAVTNEKVQHMYDIWIANDILYYTDWNTASVNALSLTTGISLQPIATGLLRPSQLYFMPHSSTKGRDSTVCSPTSLSCNGPESSCIQLLGSQQCQCAGDYALDTSNNTCVSTQSLSCGNHPVGYTFTPTEEPCRLCQCLTDRFYGDAQYNYYTCETITCPTSFSCPKPTIPPGKCCPVCPEDNCLQITNCPKEKPAKICVLPQNASQVLCPIHLEVSHCENRITSAPSDDMMYGPGTSTVTRTVKAERIFKNVTDTATCEYTVEIRDETKPSIVCPPSCIEYTKDASVKVKWQFPKVFDNAGAPSVTANPPWGSNFFVDSDTEVVYTATDESNNFATCSFNVTVKKLTGAAKCPIPRLMNGNLVCRSDVSTFTCSIKCNPGYFISNRTITDDLICSDEQWNKNITEEFEGLTCISLIGGSVQGSIGVTARKTCKGKVGHNLNYTEKILKSQFDVAYRLNTGGFDIRFAVVATCPSNSGQSKTHLSHSDLHLAIFVSGDYRDDDEKRKLKEVIDDILKDIERNMITGFLVVRVNDGQMFRDAAIDTGTGPQNISYTDDCPAGTFNDSMKCTVCPAGTYQTASACTVCPLGTYNDKERQIECTPCPAGERTSGTGSYIKDQCKGLQTPSEFTNDPGQSSTSLITIIACAAGAIIVILVIVIIVVTVKNRSRNKSYDAGGAISTQKHANACYNDSSADIYDDIHDTPPPSQASAPPGAEVYTGAAAQPNHYESLDEAKKAGETYDQISLKDEK